MIVFLVAFGGGMYLVFNGYTTIGSVTAIVQLVNFVVMPLNEIGMGMSKFREGQATLDAFEVKDVTELQTGETKEYFDDVISFSNIDFSYPNTEEKIFNHLSLKIQKGEKNCNCRNVREWKINFAQSITAFLRCNKWAHLH